MQTMSTVKKSIITAVCIALCYVLPLLFHGIQGAGQIFCPMHIPVFLCGLVCGWQFGLLCGLAGPALSSALCGMPPVSILPSMMIELAVYGLIAGIMMRCVRTRHVYADLYISLIVAIVAGRVVMSTVKKSIITAVCIALCYVLPLLFHGIQGAGQIFCPMHIPVFLCGLVCGWQFGLLCGLAGPALSSALCGMPPVSILPSMMIELAVYGLIAGIMMRCVRTRHVYADLYISLIVAIVAGRVVNGLVNALIFARGSYSMATWVAGSVVKSWPGTVIQLVFIPSIVFALMKARLIPERYPKEVPADD